jgi:hypothetical protein
VYYILTGSTALSGKATWTITVRQGIDASYVQYKFEGIQTGSDKSAEFDMYLAKNSSGWILFLNARNTEACTGCPKVDPLVHPDWLQQARGFECRSLKVPTSLSEKKSILAWAAEQYIMCASCAALGRFVVKATGRDKRRHPKVGEIVASLARPRGTAPELASIRKTQYDG